MSNALAIAAVTTTLRRLLTRALPADMAGATVTTKPLDKATTSEGGPESASNNQINLFLYQTELHPQLRNTLYPGQSKPGETGLPPLALNLYYLLTAYGQDDDDTLSHRLLGQAMLTLHDHPILGPEDVRLATETELPTSDLHQQIESVKITPQPISLEDLSKLWSTFQTQYRISTAYQVSVVLIESRRPSRAPLPVLSRGSLDDSGVDAQASLVPPYPTLTAIRLPNQQPSLRLSDAVPIVLVGQNLVGTGLTVSFRHRSLQDPVEIPIAPTAHSDTEIPVTVPNEPELWPAGYYAVSVRLEETEGERNILRTTNELPLAIAPEVTALSASRDGNTVVVTVTCAPAVLLELINRPTALGVVTIPLEQRVTLSLYDETNQLPGGDRQLPAEAISVDTGVLPPAEPLPASTISLAFRLGPVNAGTYRVRPRLRVDGIDNLLIQDYTQRPPRFVDYQDLVVP